MTLSDTELARHDKLAQAFVRHLRTLVATAFEEVEVRQASVRMLIVRIPAASPAVGDLLVESDGKELTTSIGNHTHRHTGVYLFGDDADPKAIEAAALSEAQWVGELLADKIIVWSRRGDDDVVAAGGTVADGVDGGVELWTMRRLATEAWYWSGRAASIHGSKGT